MLMLLSLRIDGHIGFEVADIEHRFKGHSPRHGTIADNADDDFIVRTAQIAGFGETERGGKRRGSVARAEEVILRFIAAQKTGNAAVLFDGGKAIPASGEHFVRVALMAHVPDDFVMGNVEGFIKGDGEFDNA